MTERIIVTLNDLPTLLAHIPADDRETWIQVGMGLKAEFGDDAFSAFDSWSQTTSVDKNYSKSNCVAVWKSFKLSGVSIGTTIKLACDNGWRPSKKELTAEDKKRLKKEAEERRARIFQEAQEDERLREKMQLQVANACFEIWDKHCAPAGFSPYLVKKKVKPYGVRFLKYSVLLVVDFSNAVERAYVLTGEDVKKFFASMPKPRPDTLSFTRMVKKGFVVPLTDENNSLWGLQYINDQGSKLFPKFCRKSGCFHQIGPITDETKCVTFVEGYATGASVYEAIEYPVIVTFDAGNMYLVAKTINEKYPHMLKVFAGDDDREATKNAGRIKAEQAAEEMGGLAIFPEFGEII